MATPSIFIRLPASIADLSTGDPALDATLRPALEQTTGMYADTAALSGLGGALAPWLVPALLDGGETCWDEAVANTLPAAELAKRRAEADARYRARNLRLGLAIAVIEELATDDRGQARLREALAFPADERLRDVLWQTLFECGGRENLAALATALDDGGEAPSKWGFAARIRLDATYAESLTLRLAAMSAHAQLAAFSGLLLAEVAAPAAWEPAVIAALAAPVTSGPARQVLASIPAGPGRLDALLALPPYDGVVPVLATFDEHRALDRIVDIVAATTLADGAARAALRASNQAHAAHACFAIIAAMKDAGVSPSRLKPFETLAKELSEKHQVPMPKKGAAKKPAAPLPPIPWPDAPPVPLPPPDPGLHAEIAAALTAAGVPAKTIPAVLSPVVALGAERVDDAAIEVGASKFGGLPDLPTDVAWPAHKKTAMSFVGQLRLDDLAGLGVAPPLPASGLLSFFVVTEDLDSYGVKGAVLYTPGGVDLVRTPPPASFQAQRAGKPGRQSYPSCKLAFRQSAQLASPSHPASPSGEAYAGVHGKYDHSDGNTVLGFRAGWDGAAPKGFRRLLAVASDPQAAFEWGDAQVLEFYVSEKGLAAGDFSRMQVFLAP